MSENTLFNGTNEEVMQRVKTAINRAKAGDEKAVPDLRTVLAESPRLVDLFGGNLAEQAERSLV